MSVSSKWITLEDFSPGIYSANLSGWGGLNTGASVIGAPIGSAEEAETYGCLPVANGKGLRPGPAATAQTAVVGAGAFGSPGAGTTVFRMLAVTMMTSSIATGTGQPYIFYGWKNAANGEIGIAHPDQALRMFAKTVAGGTVTDTAGANFTKATTAQATPWLNFGPQYIWFSYSGNNSASSTVQDAYMVPALASPDAISNTALKTSVVRRIFSHQNRVLLLQPYRMTNATANASQVWDGINYTDPANSNVFGTVAPIMDPEETGGFYAAGSVNASTLLLVKGNSGGVVVQGDIGAPLVTRVSGVTGTGFMGSTPGLTPIGLVYGSFQNGAHVWGGGSTSEKLSKQLRDDFFLKNYSGTSITASDQTTSIALQAGDGFVAKYTRDFILTTGGWAYHIPTGGWWLLDDPSTKLMQHLDVGPNGSNAFYLNGASLAGSAVSFTYGWNFDFNTANTGWQWKSQPINVGARDQMISVNEIILTAMGKNGPSGFEITGYGYDLTGATVTAPVTVTLPSQAANIPVRIRIPFVMFGYNIQFKIRAFGKASSPASTDYAPTLQSIDIGYDDSSNLVAVQ